MSNAEKDYRAAYQTAKKQAEKMWQLGLLCAMAERALNDFSYSRRCLDLRMNHKAMGEEELASMSDEIRRRLIAEGYADPFPPQKKK